MKNKCEHGRDPLLCCACRYGDRAHIDHKEKSRDLVDEINMPIGYKLRGDDEEWTLSIHCRRAK